MNVCTKTESNQSHREKKENRRGRACVQSSISVPLEFGFEFSIGQSWENVLLSIFQAICPPSISEKDGGPAAPRLVFSLMILNSFRQPMTKALNNRVGVRRLLFPSLTSIPLIQSRIKAGWSLPSQAPTLAPHSLWDGRPQIRTHLASIVTFIIVKSI